MLTTDDRYSESPALSRLLELVRQTKRYSICETEPGQFEICDDRCLLDQLLGFPELRPTTNDLIEFDFDDLLEQLSCGPPLSTADRMMLSWLMMTVEALDPNEANAAYIAAYAGGCVLRGTYSQVEYFMLAALDHRVQ